MFSKTLFVAAFAALSQMVVASPPGCMLGAINTYKNPADIKAVCQTKDITNQIVKLCGGQAQDALDAFADVCNGAGVTICTYSFPFSPCAWGDAKRRLQYMGGGYD